MILWTAFTIGLFGSLHCIGMCGPIAFALPYDPSSKFARFQQISLYQIGRILTYMAIGGVFGLLGKGIVLAGYQSIFSVGLGILLLIAALGTINLEQKILALRPLQKMMDWVKRQLSQLLRSGKKPSYFTVGLLNGLLPCGLVYVALIGAVSTGSVVQGLFYMGLFGLGTLPLMLAASLAANWVSFKMRARLRNLQPFFLIVIAALFIYRGLQFDVPFDLFLWQDASQAPMCH